MRLHKLLFSLLILLLPTQLGKHFWPDWSLVNGLRVDYLSPTLYLTDIIILAILILWIFEKLTTIVILGPSADGRRISRSVRAYTTSASIRERLLRFARNDKKKTLYYILIFCYLFFVSFLSQNQPAAFYKLVKITEFSLLGLYVVKNKFLIPNIQYPISFAVIYSSLLAIAQFLKQESIGGIFYWLGERTFTSGTPGIAQAVWNGQLILRPYATFPHPNVLAGFLVISLFLLFDSRNFRRSIPGILAMSLGMIALFLTFSRVACFIFLLSGMSFALFYLIHPPGVHSATWKVLRSDSFQVKFILIFVFLVFMSIISIVWFPIQPESISFRQDLNLAAIKMWQISPLVGVGLNDFLVELPKIYKFSGPVYFLQPAHNIFLMIGAEIGVIGVIGVIGGLILTIRRLLLTTNYLLLTTLVVVLVLGLFDHFFYTLQQGQLLLTFILGLAWSLPGKGDKIAL